MQRRDPHIQLVSVADREADICELFEEALREPDSAKLLVRAKHNRKLQAEQERLFETIHAKPIAGYQSVQLPRQHNRAKREDKLAIRFASVTLCPPKTRSGLANVEVQMVLAQEVDAPEGAEPIEWALLTTAAAGSFEQACEKVARYTQALMTQIAQTAVCYRHHSVDQRLSRWRLSTADRLPEGELVMTEELVADLLGVRRESVTKAARRLRDAG